MGRPPIGKRAMTDAERQRRRRERLAAEHAARAQSHETFRDNPKPAKKPKTVVDPETTLSREEKAEIKEQARREELERQRQIAAKDNRPKLRQDSYPVVMFGVQLWPVTEQKRLTVGYYDYDQMFFTVNQFYDWHRLIKLGVKDAGSQAKVMRENLKSSYVFAKRRLNGQTRKRYWPASLSFKSWRTFWQRIRRASVEFRRMWITCWMAA